MKTCIDRRSTLTLSALAMALVSGVLYPPSVPAAPLQGGVSDSIVVPGDDGGQYEYPAPQAVAPQRPMQAAIQRTGGMLHGGAQQQQQQARPPMRMGIQRSNTLPQGFLGVWHVRGNRSNIDALPEFQQGAAQAFAPTTDNTWQISGSPGNYTMSNGQIQTQLSVDGVGSDGTAFIRYQEQVRNTVAQEAIVLSLAPGGMQFNGRERITIVKPGVGVRAKVTYELIGQRQR